MNISSKKLTAALLAAALLAGATACAGGGSTPAGSSSSASGGASASSASKESAADSKTADGEKVTFNIYKNSGLATYPADGGQGKQLVLEKLNKIGLGNVDYKVTLIGGNEYFDKLNVLAASSSLPDYFNVNMVTLTNFADQGLIQPLEDKVDKLTHLRPLMRDAEMNAVTYDGHLYAFPVGYLPGAINGPNTNGLLIRQDWLDKLGMKMPETVDELHDVLKAFKEQDPDGNGKDDTTGLIATKLTRFEDIFGAFGVMPSFWQEAGGKLVLGSTRPETKDALQVLQNWYQEGLIDPDVFVTDEALRDQKLANSFGGVYENSAFTASVSNPETAALLAVTPTAKMAALRAVKGPGGEFGRQESEPGYGNIHAISADCQNVDLLLELLNWTADDGEDGGMYLCSVGVEGTNFEFNEDKTAIKMLTSYDDIYASGLGNPIRFTQVVDRRWLEPEAVTAFETFDGQYKENLFWGTTPAMLDYPDSVKNLFTEYMSKIIMGSLPVTAHDDYVKEFYQMGGEQIEKEVNEAYSAQK